MQVGEETYPSNRNPLIMRLLGLHWATACEYLHKQNPERVNIAFGGKLVSPHVLRIEITNCSFHLGQNVGLVRVRRTASCKPKVCHFGSHAIREENV